MHNLPDRVIFERPDYKELAQTGMQMVDMHLHTQFSHDCNSKPHLIRDRIRKLGIGLAVTDHNEYRGSLAFKKFDDIFLVPGIEVTANNDKDILMYFHSHRDLQDFGKKYIDNNRVHKSSILVNKIKTPFLDIIDAAKDFSAMVSLPHPLARAKGSYYWLHKRLHHIALKNVDAIEVINGSQRLKRNIKSTNWSAKINKLWTGGSDSHIVKTVGDVLTMSHAEKPTDFLEQVRKKKNKVIGNKTKYHQELLTALTIMKNKL